MARRGSRAGIVFMSVWLVIWTAAILVVLWMLGGAVLRGDLGGAPFLLIWLGFAGLGLYAGLRRLQTLLGLIEPPGPPAGRGGNVWTDDPRAVPPPIPRDDAAGTGGRNV
jgi:hypothetical protein